MRPYWALAAFGLVMLANAQGDPVPYVPDDAAHIHDGGGAIDMEEELYLTAKDLLRNRPGIPLSSLVDKRGKVVSAIVDSKNGTWKSKVYQRMDDGKYGSCSMNRLWGFCDHDHVYVRVPSTFQLGFKWFEVYRLQMIMPLVRCSQGSVPDPPIWATSEMFVLDMRTGTTLEVHPDNVPELFRDHPALLAAYGALSEEDRRSKRGIIALIKRYNVLHPYRLPG